MVYLALFSYIYYNNDANVGKTHSIDGIYGIVKRFSLAINNGNHFHQTFQVPKMEEFVTYISCTDTAYVREFSFFRTSILGTPQKFNI